MTSTPTRRTALAHAVSPRTWRQALQLGRADATIAPALRVGIAATVVLVAGGVLGRPDLAGFATLGAVSSAFGRYEAYPRRAGKLAVIGSLLVVYSALGGVVGASGLPTSVQILAISIGGGVAAWWVTAFAINGPGPVILVFAAVASMGFASEFADVPIAAGATAAGVAIGWIAAMFPALAHPVGPAQLAVARALAAVERQIGPAEGPSASSAILHARHVIALSGRRHRESAHSRTLAAVLDDARALVDAFERGDEVGEQSVLDHQRQLRRIRKFEAIGTRGGAFVDLPPSFFALGLCELRSRSLLLNSLRIGVASMIAAAAATFAGFEHPLWAAMGAVAAMQGITFHTTVSRGVQRLLGNVVGAAIAAGLLALSLGYWEVVVAVVLTQVAAELLVMKNYALTSIAVTPMALLLTGLASEMEPVVAWSRIGDTAIGVVVGIAVAALTIESGDRSHVAQRA